MIETKSYIKQKLIERNMDKDSLYNKADYKEFISDTGSSSNYTSYQRSVQRCYADLMNELVDRDEIISDSIVKLQANKQALLDKNNVERKINRESNRLYNHLSELYQEYIRLMKEEKLDLDKFKLKSEKIQENKTFGLIHLSDLHCNKLIVGKRDGLDNDYNFDIMNKRLKKFISEAIFYFKARKISNVGVIFTGDIINSNRRIGELLNQVTNRTKASLLTSYILKQALVELNQHFGLKVAHCVGNESRVLGEVMESSEIMCTDNYDYQIFNTLRLWLEETNIEFFTGGNPRETLVDFNGFVALLLHGDTLRTRDVGKEIKNVVAKYALKGIKINGIFCGHIHSAGIGDILSRCSSMSGIDVYPEKDLMLFDGQASQNIYLVNNDKTYDGIKVNLQDINDYEGYNIKRELEVYDINDSFVKSNNEVIIRNFI